MLVTITDFAESRDTDRDTVNAFIRNHPEIKEHTRREGKNVVIDTESEAYALLEKQYPLPQMIQVVEDTESRQKLIKAQEVIIQLQAQITEQTRIIAQNEVTKALLEDKQNQLEKALTDLDKTREEKEDLQQQLAIEQSKTWFQKLLGK